MDRNKAIEYVRWYFTEDDGMAADARVKEALQTLVPELAESKDERVRKEMLVYFKDKKEKLDYLCFECDDVKNAPFSEAKQVDDFLAYLEKHEEPNPFSGVSFDYNGHRYGMCARDSGVEVTEDGVLIYRSVPPFIGQNLVTEEYIANVFEKVGLAKIVREQGNDALTNAVQSAMIELSQQGKQKEQRNYRKPYEDIAKSEWFKKAYEGKSLGCDYEEEEQKPAEWSAENENEPMEIIFAGKVYKVYGIKELPGGINGYIIEDEPGHFDCITNPDKMLSDSRRRSKPLDYWVPTEDQLDALYHASHCAGLSAKYCLELDSLLIDLKKLYSI